MHTLIKRGDHGITILEVLLSLVMIAMIVSLVLRLYLDQYRLTSEVMQKAEVRFSIFRAGQVLTSAVINAEKVEWLNGDTLLIQYGVEDQLIVDYFYLEDKNADGKLDLYRKHLHVSNPIATGLTEMKCIEVKKGLWEIHLRASQGNQEIQWVKKVRQRYAGDN